MFDRKDLARDTERAIRSARTVLVGVTLVAVALVYLAFF
jgi:hypothetical protein